MQARGTLTLHAPFSSAGCVTLPLGVGEYRRGRLTPLRPVLRRTFAANSSPLAAGSPRPRPPRSAEERRLLPGRSSLPTDELVADGDGDARERRAVESDGGSPSLSFLVFLKPRTCLRSSLVLRRRRSSRDGDSSTVGSVYMNFFSSRRITSSLNTCNVWHWITLS
jgi:hypothetical protein